MGLPVAIVAQADVLLRVAPSPTASAAAARRSETRLLESLRFLIQDRALQPSGLACVGPFLGPRSRALPPFAVRTSLGAVSALQVFVTQAFVLPV